MKYVAMVIVMLLSGCATGVREPVIERIFRGEPDYAKLEPSVQVSPLLQECPPPAFGLIRFDLVNQGVESPYGAEKYNVSSLDHGLVLLEMSSSSSKPAGLLGIRGTPSSSGVLLSCGGLFNLAFREELAQTGVPLTMGPLDLLGLTQPERVNVIRPNRRFEVINISGLNGRLFPLAIGNELVFSYTSLVQDRPTTNGYADYKYTHANRMRVTDRYESFVVNGNTVQGAVYRIHLDDATATDSMTDFFFSETIGWPVRIDYFKDGKLSHSKVLASWVKPVQY